MKQLNRIGLHPAQAQVLAIQLNHLLAQYQIFYMNVRGFHWNIKGEKFFELHAQFEALYTNLQVKVDEIAERVLTLGYTPMHSFQDYLNAAEVQPAMDVTAWHPAVESVLEALQKIIVLQRELLVKANDAGDEGTNALMSDYIREQEKIVWMYGALIH